MTFKKAVNQTPHLAGMLKPGLQALRPCDKDHIDVEEPRLLSGSVDIDTALLRVEPNANRWDFAIAYRHKNCHQEFIYWVETHTGSDNQISLVLKKYSWLRNWLKHDGITLNSFNREFVWVPSGATSFTAGATQVKQLAVQGLRYSGSHFRILENRPTLATLPKQQGHKK
jgi:hypothetical protein